ncbi:MAG TPA: phosphate ABC transporter permease PstA [Bryobacteraceae bacterium]|nr:phosphate ABC transporter permease PstA [Bryobacteraceae bacterium]
MNYLLFRRKAVNFTMLGLTGVCTFFAVGVLVFILGYLFVHGAASLNWNFFTKLPTPVGETGGGMANAIVGSAKLLMIAMLIGVPIGFLAGVYLAEFGGGAMSFIIRYVTDLLNGVPSIVIGIFAYTVIVLPQKHFSAWAGGLALGVMMIPIAVRSSEEFLRAVPSSLREGSMALGASKAKAIFTVVIPAAKNGIITGVMLNLARVAGETAPLLFTSFSNRYWSEGLAQPTAALPVMIFTYAIAPYEDWHQQAWSAGFVLLTLVLSVNVIARLILARNRHIAR